MVGEFPYTGMWGIAAGWEGWAMKVVAAITFSIAVLILPSVALGQTPLDARSLVQTMESRLWGETNQGEFTMMIVTPDWRRTLKFDVWMDRPDRTFIRILSPKKEQGIGSLRIGSEMWNYIPRIDRVFRIPPSMMLQSWMGSDLNNDDLVKESSLVHDYTHVAESVAGGVAHIVSTPKPDAAVVWGRIESWIFVVTGIPQRQIYYDENGRSVREMTFSDIKSMDGRMIPTHWEVHPANKSDKWTEFIIRKIRFDEAIDPKVFSRRNLRSREW